MQWGVILRRYCIIFHQKTPVCDSFISCSIYTHVPVKQYHERSEKQKEVYHAYIAARKSETASTDPPQTLAVGDSPQTEAAQATPATGQTIQVEMTATESVVGLSDAGTHNQEQRPSPPAPTHPKVVVGPNVLLHFICAFSKCIV